MKPTIHFSLLASLIFICSSFTKSSENGLDITFGVSDNNPAQIELNLNDDFTFTYQDLSVTSEKIKVKGSYQIKNNKIHLIPTDNEVEFHDTWKISEDQTTAKSRKGMTFYTLRRK